MRAVEADGPFSPKTGAVLRLPIAHGEGRYQAAPEVLARLEGEGRIALVYCTRDGAVTADANPNGSVRNVAGIYGGPSKNVLGLMPHPERMSEECLGGKDGLELFLAVAAARPAAA
jgi:phosphoribosylformylglycinamidine synthase subunit PurQ / glutaminase